MMKLAASVFIHRNSPPMRRRTGAILSLELIIGVPIIMAFLFALIEISMLWSGNHRVAAAARAGCRAATMPGSDHETVQKAVIRAIGTQALVKSHTLRVKWGQHTGDPVYVEVRAPMSAVAPDLLTFFGFSLGERELVAQCVMRKE